MARVLFAWELGGNLGHIGKLYPVAKELFERGHEIYVATKNLYATEAVFADLDVTLIQSPHNTCRISNDSLTRSLTEILLHQGYDSKESLLPLVKAWQALIGMVGPDIMFFDYAPTAQLAVRQLDMPKVLIGSSFWVPSPGMLPVDICFWRSEASTNIEASERRAVSSINAVAGELSISPVNYLSDLYLSDHTYFFHPEDFDQQSHSRENTLYVVPPEDDRSLPKVTWPANSKKNIFAYLRAASPNGKKIMSVLAHSGHNVSAYYVPSDDEGDEWNLIEGVDISSLPLDVDHALLDADVVVCHAGIGMISAALHKGKPLFLVPTQLEQLSNSLRVERMLAGLWVDKKEEAESAMAKLQRLLTESQFSEGAQAVSQRYRGGAPEDSVGYICDQAETLLGVT